MSQCILPLLYCKHLSGLWPIPLSSLQHKLSSTLEVFKHWRNFCIFPNDVHHKYQKSLFYGARPINVVRAELRLKKTILLPKLKYSLRPSSEILIRPSLYLESWQNISTSVYNMADLPLKSKSLNSVANEIDLHKDELKQFSNGVSSVKTSLKRKSNSIEHSYDEKTKENCSSSEASDLQRSPVKRMKRPFTVSVEGNIGSGKSTFLKYFSKNPNIATYQEPIKQWTNLGGHNLLGKLYEDPDRWNFLFQSFVQLTRLKIHLDQPNVKAKLIERSFQNNRFCFLEHAHDTGNLNDSEFNVLTEYYDFFDRQLNIGIDLIVYLRTSPEVVFERMKKRGRSEEASVSLEYLQGIHKYYEHWLMESKPNKPPAPVLIINGDLDLDTLLKEYEKQLPFIIGKKKYENGSCTKSITSLLDTPEV